MSYGQNTSLQTAGAIQPEGKLQSAARDAVSKAFQVNDRLSRLLDRLRVAPPRPVESGSANVQAHPTLDSSHQTLAAALANAHALLDEIEGMV